MMTNTQKLSLFRELLASVAGALVAYGVGSEALWQEAVGVVLGVMTLIWAWQANPSWEIISTTLRKTLSAAGGMMVITGVIDPTRMELLLGVILNAGAIYWAFVKKEAPPGPPVPVILLLAGASCLLLTACPNSYGEYPLTGSIMYRDSESGAKAGMTFSPGTAPKANVFVPLYDENGKLISLAELEYDFSRVDTGSSK